MKSNLYNAEVTSIILLIITIIISYFTLSYKIFVSNLFILSCYLIVVPTLFFTFGAYIEKLVIRSQILRIINDLKTTAKNVDFTIPPLDIPKNDNLDNIVKEKNKNLIERTVVILSSISVTGIIIIIVLWYLKKNFSLRKLILKDMFIILLIIIIEILFFGVITRNYRSIDVNLIKYTILTELSQKAKDNTIDLFKNKIE